MPVICEQSIYRTVLTGEVPGQQQLVGYGFQQYDVIIHNPDLLQWSVLRPGDPLTGKLPAGWKEYAVIGL